jgi:hypothetical protein
MESMNLLIDLRVVQTIEWIKDANAGWIRVPVGYEIQMLREGSEDWEKLDIFVNEIPNPEKEAEDGQGTA